MIKSIEALALAHHRKIRFPSSSIIIFLVALLLAGAALTSASDGIVQLYFFYSEDCDHCQVVMEEVLPVLAASYPLEPKFLEINDSANYRAMVALEEQLGQGGGDIPVVIVGETVLEGEEEITLRLEEVVADYLSRGGATLLPIPTFISSPTPTGEPPCPVAYFFKPGCQECDRTLLDLQALGKEVPLKVEKFSMADRDNLALLEAVEETLEIPERRRLVPPTVIVGRKVLVGREATFANLQQAVLEADPSLPPVWEIGTARGRKRILDRFSRLTFLPVAGAGLLDGINPCAFATLIFFLSYLSMVGRRGKDLLIVGSAFTAAVFATYLLVGLGFATVIGKLSFLAGLSRWIYRLTFLLALTLGFLNLYDWRLARRGRLNDITLQLPDGLKKAIHKVIRSRVRLQNLAAAALVTGILVSLLELACTGQVYLPTILYVMEFPAMRVHAALYLILYNLMFIVPLLVVFTLAYLGTTSQTLTDWMRRHAPAVKLATAGLFFLLAGLMTTVL